MDGLLVGDFLCWGHDKRSLQKSFRAFGHPKMCCAKSDEKQGCSTQKLRFFVKIFCAGNNP